MLQKGPHLLVRYTKSPSPPPELIFLTGKQGKTNRLKSLKELVRTYICHILPSYIIFCVNTA